MPPAEGWVAVALRPLLSRADLRAVPLVAGRVELETRRHGFEAGSEAGEHVVIDATTDDFEAAFAAASVARLPDPDMRAELLDRAANLIACRRAKFMALLAIEKDFPIRIASQEVREASARCRQFAALTRSLFVNPKLLKGPTGESNELRLTGRGAIVCLGSSVSPLAEFVAQIAAAFGAGNPVVAKPSSQAPLTGSFAVRSLLEAGIPPEALAFLPGEGDKVGRPLVADLRCAGVAISGSQASAQAVNRAAALRDGPIIPVITRPVPAASYLLRFANERTVTINTAAAGGNASLMVGSADQD